MARTNSRRSPRCATDIDRALGERIRAWWIALGITQQQMAGRLGISYQQVRKYEIGANRISVVRLCDLCRVLGLVPAELLTDPAPVAKPVEGVRRDQLELARHMMQLTPRHRQAVMRFVKALGASAG